MTQKYAAFDTSGAIVAFYDEEDSPPPNGAKVIKITDVQWKTAIANPGACKVDAGRFVDPPELTVAQQVKAAQVAKLGELRHACATAILAGFQSSALGQAYTYPAATVDQQNMVQTATAGGGTLMCKSSSGGWALVPHTGAQAAQVLKDFVAARDAARSNLASLSAAASTASTVAAVGEVHW